MKLAIHAPRVSYYYGGAERYIINLFSELLKLNKETYLVTYDAPKKSEWFSEIYKSNKSKVVLIKSQKMDKLFDKFQNATLPADWDKESKLFAKEANKFYGDNHFSDISVHYAVDCLNLNVRANTHLHLHGLPDKRRPNETKGLKKANQVIAVSKYVGDGWKKLHGFNGKIFVVHNGIKVDKLLKWRKRDIDVIYFGRLIKIKGVDLLLKAINLLNKEGLHVSCRIIGEGPEKVKLQNFASKKKLKDITFLGNISDKLLKEVLISSKIAVFPSYKREGIMTTLLEAANSGVAIIASDSCSNREFIEDNQNGLIFKERDYIDLSKKIEYLLSFNEKRELLALSAKNNLNDFSWNKKSFQIFNLYLTSRPNF